MSQLCSALHLQQSEWLKNKIVRRKNVGSISGWPFDNDPWSFSVAPQTLARAQSKAVQLGSNGPLKVEAYQDESGRYTRICREDGTPVSVVTAGVVAGDFVVHTSGTACIVFRPRGSYFEVVGKLHTATPFGPEGLVPFGIEGPMPDTDLDVWLGVDDIVAHFAPLYSKCWTEWDPGIQVVN